MRHTMRCPECDYEMGVRATKTTRSVGGKLYDWTQFWCKRHDIWIELETPHEEESS